MTLGVIAVLGLLGLVFVVSAVALVGAIVLSSTSAAGTAVAATAAVILVLAPPLSAAVALVRRLPRMRPAIVTLSCFVLWSAALLGLALGPLAARSRVALSGHGTWMIPEPVEPTGRALIEGALAVFPAPSPSTSTTTATRGQVVERPRTATTAVAPPPVQPTRSSAGADDRAWSAKELFERRAGSVLLVRVQMQKSVGEILEEAGKKKAAGARADKAESSQPRSARRQEASHWIAGAGSGFFVSSDGLFVTNHHVLGEAGRASVQLQDGRRIHGVEVLALDPANDLALARVDLHDAPVAPITSRSLSVGEPVFAIGSPLGLEFTLTQGIVSALREVGGTRMVQMQADIAPGSSGGPLFNDKGEIVGVNTAVRAPGLNFAVHADHVRYLMAVPRKPNKLEPYRAGLTIAALEIEGAKFLPTSRMNLEQILQIVGMVVDRCISDLPKGAHLELPLDREAITTNLDANAKACIEKASVLPRSAVAAVVEHWAPAAGALRIGARLEGLSIDSSTEQPASERSLVLRLVRGDPGELGPPRPLEALTSSSTPGSRRWR